MQEYWHTIRQEDSTEMYFWKSKICYVTSNWYASQHISTGPTIYKKAVPHSWQHIGKQNSDTQQIGNVKKIRKELFKFDDIDDDILANAAFEAESKLSSVKWKNNYNLCDTYQYWTDHYIVNGQRRRTICCVWRW